MLQPSRAYPEKAKLLQYFKKSTNIIYYVNKLKKKSCITESIDAEMALEKTQHPFKI